MSKNTPRLGGGLIARKGEAAPTTANAAPAPADAPAAASREAPAPAQAEHGTTSKGLAGTIAVTVRLDPARYERLKIHGARQRLSNQQILVAALDAYLATTPADHG